MLMNVFKKKKLNCNTSQWINYTQSLVEFNVYGNFKSYWNRIALFTIIHTKIIVLTHKNNDEQNVYRRDNLNENDPCKIVQKYILSS